MRKIDNFNQEDILNLFIEKKVTYLLGAGASAPFFGSLGAFEDLLTHDKMREEDKRFLKIVFYLASIKKNDQLFDNQINDEKDNILQEYKHFIHNTIELLKVNNSRLSPRRSTIMTTNYDLFLEKASEDLNHENPRIFINDGSSGFFTKYFDTDNFNKAMIHRGIDDNYSREIPTLNIIKCHGSVNWEKSEYNQIKLLNDNFLFLEINKKIEEHKEKLSIPEEWKTRVTKADTEYVEEFFESIFKLDRYEKLQEINREIEFENIVDDIQSFVDINKNHIYEIYEDVNKLQIVWPTKQKLETTLINQNYYEMLRLLSYELETDERVLLVFGFSFYDEHITNIVKRSLYNPGLIVFILCYNDNAKAEIIKQFNLSVNTIPNNMKFISPADFQIPNIDLENTNGTEYLIIENNNNKTFYDKRLSKNIMETHEEAVIDFKALNKLVSTEMPNKYEYPLVEEEGSFDWKF